MVQEPVKRANRCQGDEKLCMIGTVDQPIGARKGEDETEQHPSDPLFVFISSAGLKQDPKSAPKDGAI